MLGTGLKADIYIKFQKDLLNLLKIVCKTSDKMIREAKRLLYDKSCENSLAFCFMIVTL